MVFNRRSFLQASALAGAGQFLRSRLPSKSAIVPGTEPTAMARIAQMLKTSEPDSIYEPLAKEIRAGASLTDVMGGVLLAGVRDIEPRPVGFKLHAVMMVGSALDLAQEAQGRDRWYPAFWNAHDFKRSQRQDRYGGDWVMPDLPKVPNLKAGDALTEFIQAMDRWDEPAIDVAAVTLFPHLNQTEFFELLWLPGARCFSNLGHKIIYTAQAYRALHHLGWRACGLPLIRSLAYALLEDKPGQRIDTYQANVALAKQFPANWAHGKDDPSQSAAIAKDLLSANALEASGHILKLVQDGLGLQTIWDGYRLAAADFLFRDPSLLPVHPFTALNGLHIGFQTSQNQLTKKVLLLQAASFLTFYRQELGRMRRFGNGKTGLLSLKPLSSSKRIPLGEAFEMTVGEAEQGQRAMLSVFEGAAVSPAAFAQIRQNLFQKAVEHHQYKYTAAMFQECRAAHPRWAAHLFAGGLGYLPHHRGQPTHTYLETRRVIEGL